MTQHLRAVLYVRMSTDRQEDSPDRQRSLIRPAVEQSLYRVVREYEDLEAKGWDETRPGLQQMIVDARAGLFDIILVDEWSRLTRSDFFATVTDIIAPLRAAGVRLHTVKDGIRDWNDIAGQIMLVVDTNRSEAETKDIARRTLSQLMETARQGKLFLGPTPYGYKAIEARGKKSRMKRVGLVPGDSAQVEVVRHIFDRYVHGGKGVTALAKELTDAGHPPPDSKGWHPSTVSYILRNPNYAGHYRFNRVSTRRFAYAAGGTVHLTETPNKTNRRTKNAAEDMVIVQNTHEPLVSQEVWDRAQEMAKVRQTNKAPAVRTTRFLTGVLHCWHCKRVMYHALVLKRIHKWRCATEMRRLPTWGSCKCYQIDEEVALPLLLTLLRDTVLSAQNRQRFMELVQSRALVPGAIPAGLKRKLAQVEKRIERGYDNLLDTPREMAPKLRERIQALEEERERLLEQQAAPVPRSGPTPEEVVKFLVDGFDELQSLLSSSNVYEANVALRKFVARADVEFETVRTTTGKKERHIPRRMHVTLAGAGPRPAGQADS